MESKLKDFFGFESLKITLKNNIDLSQSKLNRTFAPVFQNLLGMQCVELNQVGNFDPWEQEKIDELFHMELSDSLSDRLIFENERVKLWDLYLGPGERIPFRKINSNLGWVCPTGGLAICRYGNGKINMVKLDPGDAEYFEYQSKNFVYDLENIGEHPISINILEYKQTQPDNSLQLMD